MVNFRKRLNSKKIEKKTNPLEIYGTLDRDSTTSSIRPAQEFILKEWYENRKEDKNLIVKLHTGQGKTLIGLLMLLSKINSNNAPCLYVCPNKYLVQQTVLEAEKFGIPHCTFGKTNEIPDSFINGEKILITNVNKVFNGKTVFGLNHRSINVKNIVLDDSHACIDSLKSSFTVKVKKDEDLYNKILTLFSEDLSSQGEGSFLDIKNGKFESILPIPYWSWVEKKSEILQLLSDEEDNLSIKFAWPILKDSIINYQAYVSGSHIEISPYHIPIHHFGTFNDAEQRILMSATTQDDSFFIKGLGFDIKSIEYPLIDPKQKWSGEKMLLLPSLIDESLSRYSVIKRLAKPIEKNFGFVSIVPSYNFTRDYSDLGATIAHSNNIFDIVQNLKNGNFENTVAIVNRYDGIDLPDKSCRLLILDSKPFFDSLSDRYEEDCRKDSDTINTKIAQKIEQGLGRSVRGEKDYSVIILVGGNLIKFIKSSLTNKYFSSQTRQHIKIGLEIADAAREELKEEEDAFKTIVNLLNQSLKRDDGWKDFYQEKMEEIDIDNKSNNNLLKLFSLEQKAEEFAYNKDYEKAIEVVQQIINKCKDNSEKGWYQQSLARYTYFISKIDSEKIQKSAFKKNYQLIHPKGGIAYKKLEYINENRINRIKTWINQYSDYEELMLSVNKITSELSFGMPSEKFELALQELGLALGFLSQRPDKEFKKGPDNLWCGIEDKYILIECKNEVLDTRTEISKYEAGQMNSHCGWFEETYSDKPNQNVKRIIIIPTKNLSYYANFTHRVEVMRKNRLKLLKDNFLAFFREFKKYNIHQISEEKLTEFINAHKLDVNSFFIEYTEEYYHKGK